MSKHADADALTRLRAFVQSEKEHCQLLERIGSRLSARLRFTAARRRATCVDPVTDGFFDVTRQLASLHRLYADKLDKETVMSDSDVVASVLNDLVLAVRDSYIQLQVQRERIASALEERLEVLLNESTPELVLFLAEHSFTADKLVSQPLDHFHRTLDGIESLVDPTSPVQSVCRETRALVESEARRHACEQHLLQLQERFYNTVPPVDLFNKTLLYEDVATVKSSDQTDASPSEMIIHCFDDGLLLLSRQREATKEGALPSLQVQYRIHVRSDPIFLETQPESIETEPTRASFALVFRDTVLLLSLESSPKRQQLIDAIQSQLNQNEARRPALREGRTSEDLALPTELQQSPQKPLMVFPSFEDDDLPGVFWMQQADSTNVWQPVELVKFDSWLLIFALHGWKQLSLLHQVDLTRNETDILESAHGEKNWGLTITKDSQKIVLVSLLRSRVDFWYDQVFKALQSRVVEVQKTEESAKHASNSFIERKKKRVRNTVEVEATHTADEETQENKASPEQKTPAKRAARSRKKESTEGVAATAAQIEDSVGRPETADSSSDKPQKDKTTPEPKTPAKRTARPRKRKADEEEEEDAALKDASTREPEAQPETAASAIKKLRSPPVKTPKQRWVRRKTEDPEDSTLVSTQPSEETEASTKKTETSGVRIIFTGLEMTPKYRKKINAIDSAQYEEEIELVTHVIAPKNKLKRTVKLLCGISSCDHILDERWLDESARVGLAVFEKPYCLKDTEAEAKWQFDLHKTMYDYTKEQRRQLFRGHRIYIVNHKSVLPPVQDLVKIVEHAGGTAITSGAPDASDLVITTETAMGVAAIQKTLASANPQRLYTPELVLSSILQQHIDFDQHRVPSTSSFSSSSSRRSTGGSSSKR